MRRGHFMIKIIPIVNPNIDIASFIKASHEALGYNPLSGVDQSTRSFSDPAKFLTGLSAFHNKMNLKAPLSSLREAGSLCNHLSYGFMVAAPKQVILKSLERTELHHTIAEDLDDLQLTVISGTLKQWKHGLLECCHPDSSHQLRLLYDGFYFHFQKQGLGELWFDIKTAPAPNKTFYLEKK